MVVVLIELVWRIKLSSGSKMISNLKRSCKMLKLELGTNRPTGTHESKLLSTKVTKDAK